MVTKIKLFEHQDLTTLDFCLWVSMQSEVYKRKVDKPDELLARVLEAAARIKKREDQLRRETHDFRSQVARFVEVDGGIC